MNIQSINETTKQQIEFALNFGELDNATKIVARIWKRIFPFNGSQITCDINDARALFGWHLTARLIEAEIFDHFGGANNQIVRRF